MNGSADLVGLLIEKGANVDGTMLHLAAKKRSAEILKILLENGADIDSRDSRNRTPLHVATMNGSADLVSLLIEKGANVDGTMQDAKGKCTTSLHFAAENGSDKILLENGA